MGAYNVTDNSEHDDLHRGCITLDEGQLNITITSEGIIIDLYNDDAGELAGTFANTFTELAEMIMEDS